MKKPSLSYRPPYTVSGKAMELLAEISAAVERYRILLEGPEGLRLRKANHVRTLRGTTAIEGNTLTEDQITAILAGKRVAAPAREIAEIRGAHAAYDAIESFDPLTLDDLLKAHGLMTAGLVARPGKWRNVNVGVVDGLGNVVHMAPPFSNVPHLMADLFAWLRADDSPMPIKSCVFHYEFEFIHPFPDGNGRTGRLWQTVLLGSWRKELLSAPVENIVWTHQQEYYRAIRESSARADSGPFIDFMLDKILRALTAKGEAAAGTAGKTAKKTTKKTTKKTSPATTREPQSAERILAVIRAMPDVTVREMAEATGLSVDGVNWNIRKLKTTGRLRRVGPDKGGHWEVVD